VRKFIIHIGSFVRKLDNWTTLVRTHCQFWFRLVKPKLEPELIFGTGSKMELRIYILEELNPAPDAQFSIYVWNWNWNWNPEF
jgi:hypothetical protein